MFTYSWRLLKAVSKFGRQLIQHLFPSNVYHLLRNVLDLLIRQFNEDVVIINFFTWAYSFFLQCNYVSLEQINPQSIKIKSSEMIYFCYLNSSIMLQSITLLQYVYYTLSVLRIFVHSASCHFSCHFSYQKLCN